MTDTVSCSALDAFLDGDLSARDASAFEAHAASCAECTSDLAVSRLLEAEWSAMAAVSAPPAVVEAALVAARRRATDRPPAARTARPRHLRLVAFGVLAVVVASAALWLQRDASPAPPLQASTDTGSPGGPATETVAPALADADGQREPVVQPDPVPSETPASPAAAPARRPARPAVESAAPPRPSPIRPANPDPAARDAVPTPPRDLVAQAAPAAPDSVAQARQDLLLALSLVADAQSRASATVNLEFERATDALSDTHLF